MDEQLVTTRSQCPFKVYIPSKPGKYGVKLWALADAQSFYCMNVQPYIGRNLTITGTIRKNKSEIPQQLLPNPVRGEHSSLFAFQQDATMISYVPKKNKAVIMLSTLLKDTEV